MKIVLAAGVLAAMAFAVPANAATIQVVSGDQRSFGLGSNGNTVGQSFTAIDTNLTSFGFQFRQYLASGNVAAPNLSYTLTLVNGAGLNGTPITTRTFTVPTSIGGTTPTWIDVNITGTLVALGQVYTAVLTSGNIKFGLLMGPDINLFNGQELAGDAYTGGRAFFAQPIYPNCAITGNCDLNFRVTGTTATGAVPEPATWAMMMLGFGALGTALRRRPRQTNRIRFA